MCSRKQKKRSRLLLCKLQIKEWSAEVTAGPWTGVLRWQTGEGRETEEVLISASKAWAPLRPVCLGHLSWTCIAPQSFPPTPCYLHCSIVISIQAALSHCRECLADQELGQRRLCIPYNRGQYINRGLKGKQKQKHCYCSSHSMLSQQHWCKHQRQEL